MAEKPGTESLILASLADHKRSQNHVVLCKQGMYIVCTIVRPEMPGKCTTRTCTMYIRGCQSDDFLLPWILQLGQFEVVEIVLTLLKYEANTYNLFLPIDRSNSQNWGQ